MPWIASIPGGAGLSKTGSFTVPDPQEDDEGEAPAEQFTTATLTFHWTTATVTLGDPLYIYICSEIQLTVSPTGGLAGDCNERSSTNDPQESAITGTLAGQWDRETITVSFLLTTHMVVTGQPGNQLGHWEATVAAPTATAGILAGAQASGTATWAMICNAHPNLSCYNLKAHREAGGAVAWSMVFSP